jgi:hypothetical protein
LRNATAGWGRSFNVQMGNRGFGRHGALRLRFEI